MDKSGKKRLRVFAGPNGSGKTTIIKAIEAQQINGRKISFGTYVNADDIEYRLRKEGCISLADYGLSAQTNDLEDFLRLSSLREKLKSPVGVLAFQVRSNKIYCSDKDVNSYHASLIAAFLRHKLTEEGKSYSFETVMSHESKLEEMAIARKKGYRIYLYYVATLSPEINIDRIKNRVEKGGHPVDPQKVNERYQRAMNLLFDAVLLTDRAYIFDNSGVKYELVAEITGAKLVDLKETVDVPAWFYDNFYLKAIKKNK